MDSNKRHIPLILSAILFLVMFITVWINQRDVWQERKREIRIVEELKSQLDRENSVLLPVYINPLNISYRDYLTAAMETRSAFTGLDEIDHLYKIYGNELFIKDLNQFKNQLIKYQDALLHSLYRATQKMREIEAQNTFTIDSVSDFSKRRTFLGNDYSLTLDDFLDNTIIIDIQNMNMALFIGIKQVEKHLLNLKELQSQHKQKELIILFSLLFLCILSLILLIASILHRIRYEKAISQSKSRFFSMVSHELRTPLNVIIGLVHLMKKAELPVLQKERLEKLDMTSQGLLALINDVLDYSKLDAQKMVLESEPFSPGEHLKKTSEIYKTLIEQKGLEQFVFLDENIPSLVLGDSFRIHQILSNLISNGIKFTEKGSITIGIRLISEIKDTVWISFYVSDTGIGIPKEKRASLFESFTQADESTTRQFGGTGLGLFISNKLVQLMNGRIVVTGKPGEGSKFSVELPFKTLKGKVSSSLIKDSETGEKMKEEKIYPGSHILLVEDHPINREIIETLLNDKEIEVTSAANGEEGIHEWQKGNFDLIFMDIQMPGIDGFTASKKIRSEEKGNDHIPIIAMTAHTMAEQREQSRKSGMDGYITKPLVIDELYRTLEKWLSPYGQPKIKKDEIHHRELIDKLQKDFPHIQLDSALKRVNNNLPVYLDLLKSTITDTKESLGEINKLLSLNKKDEIIVLCHSLRGPLGNLGVKSLYHSFSIMEKELKEGNDPTPEKIAELDSSLDILQNQWEKVWKESIYQRDMKGGHPEKAVTETEDNLIYQLINALKKGQPQECSLLLNSLQKSLTQEENETYNKLEDLIDSFNFDKALELIEK